MEVLNSKLQDVIDQCANKFLSLIEKNVKGAIRVVAHNDTDGITSSAIIVKVLKRLNLQYWLTNLKVFDDSALENLMKEEWEIAFILDFGLNEEKLKKLDSLNRKVFIIDHHILKLEAELRNVNIISSYMFNEDLSAAGVAYFFGKIISEKNKDLAPIAIIGLVGDRCKINPEILKDAVDSKKLIVKKGLTIFGASTKPLHRALALSDIFLPGVSGNENNALELIKQAGINPMDNGRYRTLLDLNEEETKKLCTVVAARSKNTDFIANVHLININGNLYDSKELSAIINACGRFGCSEAGIKACHGKIRDAEKLYGAYKKEIVAALKWFEANKENGNLLEACNGKVWLINAKSEIKDTIIGVITSMLASHYKDKILIGMAKSDEKIKISARATNINVKEFLDKVLEGIVTESGGHKAAAGGLIDKKNEKVFIDRIKSLAAW